MEKVKRIIRELNRILKALHMMVSFMFLGVVPLIVGGTLCMMKLDNQMNSVSWTSSFLWLLTGIFTLYACREYEEQDSRRYYEEETD